MAKYFILMQTIIYVLHDIDMTFSLTFIRTFNSINSTAYIIGRFLAVAGRQFNAGYGSASRAIRLMIEKAVLL